MLYTKCTKQTYFIIKSFVILPIEYMLAIYYNSICKAEGNRTTIQRQVLRKELTMDGMTNEQLNTFIKTLLLIVEDCETVEEVKEKLKSLLK